MKLNISKMLSWRLQIVVAFQMRLWKRIICVNTFQLFLSIPSSIVSNDSMVDLIDHFLFPRFRAFSIFQFLISPMALADQVLHGV